jgi:predicted small secreted protein
MNRSSFVLFTLLSLGGLTACNTTEGFGQDVEAAGDEIEEIARNAEEEMTNDD